MHIGSLSRLLVLLASGTLVAAPATLHAQQTLTAADYDRAAKMLSFNVNPLVIGGTVSATWLPDDRFYYRDVTATGADWVIVNPAKKSRAPLFRAPEVAQALTRAGAGTIDPRNIPAQRAELSADGLRVTLVIGTRRWSCDVSGGSCNAVDSSAQQTGGRASPATPPVVLSPDGKRAAFIRDWNLWVRDVATGRETQLTTDGVKNFGYATDNAGWVHSDRAILLWSPDSKKIATQQQDERNVGDMFLLDTRVGHQRLSTWKGPLPGDSVVAMIHRVIIDMGARTIVRLQTPPDFHRAMLGDDLDMGDLVWSPDASRLAYVSTSRDHKRATVKLADAATGTVRTIFEETSPTQFESVAGWRVIWPLNEIVWSSERDDWAQLYLYDLTTGKLKQKITTGAGPVQSIKHVDEKRRTLLVEGLGRIPGEDPHFRHYYRVELNGRGWTAITPESGDHSIQVSPTGRYFIDSWSKPDVPPTVVLRDKNGRSLMALGKADISQLLAAGWKPPIPIVTRARDGKTDLYGLMFRPTNFDSTKRYPIINNAYPGPQSGSVGSRSFSAARGDRQALAELGFVVIAVDGMGTPNRSKSFHDAYYGAMGRDNTLPDQVAAMKELASRYPWIDVERAGMYGHSGGGFITADAMFRYPDFFKVGIAESGNHDQRNYEDDWGERYQGLLVKSGNAPDNYDVEANQNIAKNLKGHLLLAHGTMDDNVPPSNTDLVVDALIKANKDFDLLMIPNARHGYAAASNYMTRRRWDYFVRYLLNADPPKEYEIVVPAAPSSITYPPRTGAGTGGGSSSANFHGCGPARVSGWFSSRARTIAIGIGPP
ncbi:MAG: DPP IV N-terminal domain-containing protein [Gemmatimonadaceae bacterium]|nr:DPP IV N-terminal domain-containing protein [Gemmatimonadaceae bacterium]